jgi:hypothetical protein
MSEVLGWAEAECSRARELMAGFVDGELAAGESEWLGGHLGTCAECRATLAAFAEIDSELTGWGERLESAAPPPPGAREQLAAKLGSRPAGRRAIRWAAAAAIAAALVAAVVIPHSKKPVGAGRDPAQFVAIPYLPPLDPRENAAIVRMNIRVATLIAAGYRVAGDPNAVVPADVLVGEDGRAHAVRVLSDIHLN